MPKTPGPAAALAISALAAAAGLARAQVARPEIEPNDSKVAATPVTVAPGDWLQGVSTGSNASGTPTSADYFLVRTQPGAAAIYRHRLTLSTAGAVAHTGMIRGLVQNDGVIQTIEDAIQSTSSTSSAPRFTQWYGFGREERLYYRVTGASQTTATYTAAYERAAVSPVVLAPVPTGQTTITTVGQTGSPQTDTDLWIYDSTFRPIPGFGNDDTSIAANGSGSTLTRTLSAGTYYLALTSFNLANDQPSPADDYYRYGQVLDFPDIVANSYEVAPQNISFRITDSASAVRNVAATKAGAFDIAWFRLDVQPPATCYPNCDHSTAVPFLNVLDFACYLQKFAAADPYANCDGSTTPPAHNVIDFACFLQKFAAGCSAP
jgi:hypothetical protein